MSFEQKSNRKQKNLKTYSVDSAPSSVLQIPSNERDEMVLVCSGLKTNRDRIMYKNFIKKFDLKEKNAIDKNVTHLVVSVNPQNCADRTLKFLQAITNKCWIISLTWVQECLTQDTLFIPESFEVLDTNNQPGPNRSRHGLLYIWMELLSIFFCDLPT